VIRYSLIQYHSPVYADRPETITGLVKTDHLHSSVPVNVTDREGVVGVTTKIGFEKIL